MQLIVKNRMSAAAAESANEKKKEREGMEGRIQLEFTERRKERRAPQRPTRGRERERFGTARGEERRGEEQGREGKGREGNAARATKGKRRGEKGSVKLGPTGGGI